MARFVKPLSVSLAAAAVVLATARPAAAQLVWIRPAYPGYNPFVYRFMYSSMYFPSPTGGYGFTTFRQFYSTSPLVTYIYNPGYAGGYMYGGYGSASQLAGAGLNLAAKDQLNLQQAQRNARNDAAARQQIFDQWAYERGSKRIDGNNLNAAPEGLRQAVLNPSEGDLASGKALNELLAAIQTWEAKGAKAESPFLPPDSLAKIVFAGSPAADALNMIRAGQVEFPAAFRTADFDELRGTIEHDVAAAAAQARTGKKVDPGLFDRIADAAKRLKAKAGPAVRGDVGFDDAASAVGFANRLEGAARYLKSADASGLFVPAWQTVGVALSDLSKFMGRYKLQFGPAAAGDEGVYAALHRAMVGYYGQLSQARR